MHVLWDYSEGGCTDKTGLEENRSHHKLFLHSIKMRSKFHHGDLRNALIQSGLQILAQESIQALSLRKVAKSAGVSEAAPYRHFKDKEALLAAIA